jgi:hypothetical protein
MTLSSFAGVRWSGNEWSPIRRPARRRAVASEVFMQLLTQKVSGLPWLAVEPGTEEGMSNVTEERSQSATGQVNERVQDVAEQAKGQTRE